MNIDEYRNDLLEEVKTDSAANGIGQTAAFANKITQMMQEAEYLSSDFQSAFYSGIGKRNSHMRVDGYIQDDTDGSMLLFVVCYMNEDGNLTKTLANSYFKMLSNFVGSALGSQLYEEIEPSTPVADLVEILRTDRNEIHKYKFFLLTNTKRSLTLQSFDNLEIDQKDVECQIWDIDRIYEMYSSTQIREPILINFLDYVDDGIPCLEADIVGVGNYKSYLCIISGEILADIYDKYGSRLLEGNVRSFLSSKRAVNKKIRETILNEPTMFFAFNNGIAATAMDLDFIDTAHGKMLSGAKDFQIINGGQTTASLSNTRFRDKADLSKIYVQMKLTMIGEMDLDRANELIRNISKSSNSQNKVSDADFFATHVFHIEIEKISRRIYAPAVQGAQYGTRWFYERARGQYLQEQMKMTKAQKNQFLKQHPKDQVITKTDFAKYRRSWEGAPDMVSKGAQTNFMKFAEIIDEQWNKKSSQFNERYFKETVAIAILFKKLEQLVSKQPWYNSYRANIVTYSLALFHHAIIQRFHGMEFDLIQVWNNQSMPSMLIPVFEQITKDVNDFITGDRPVVNVTQWCKQALCWKKMKEEVPVKLPDSLVALMQSKEAARDDIKKAIENQKFDENIGALSIVVKIDGTVWKKIEDDANRLHLLTNPKEISALKVAVKIPKVIPQDFQANELLNLLKRLKENGCVY